MQQVRLVGAAPSLASASVSLNTLGLFTLDRRWDRRSAAFYTRCELFYAAGYVASAFVALAVVTVILTKPRHVKVTMVSWAEESFLTGPAFGRAGEAGQGRALPPS